MFVFAGDVALRTWNNPLVPQGAELIAIDAFIANPANWRIMIDLGLAAVFAGLFVVPLQAMAQRRAAPELRGRLLAAGGILNAATATAGQFVLALIAVTGLPIQTAFVSIAVISAGAAAFIGWRLAKRWKTRGDSPS